ncbi:MAG: DUF4397 domain-containing protein [Betaproteobacteria bacterium]
MNSTSRTALLACAVASAAFLAGCGGDDATDALNVASPQARLVNAIPGSGALQFYRNADLQSDAGALPFETSSKYFDTVATTSTWSVRVADTGTEAGSTSLMVSGSTRYTFIAFPGVGTQADLVTFSDPYDVSLNDTNARLRVVNAATNDGSFDVYITAPGASIASATPQMTGVAYKAVAPVSGENSYSFAHGTYEIRLTLTGTKLPFFDAQFVAGDNDDLLMMTVANSAVAGDVKIYKMPSDNDVPNSEIANTL